MKATVIPALAAAVILASAAGFAQTAPPAGTKADTLFVTVQPQGQWLASRFVGQAVSNPGLLSSRCCLINVYKFPH